MTNEQLYIMVGAPLIFNALLFLVLNFRIGGVESGLSARMTSLEGRISAGETSLGARLTSLESTMHKLFEMQSRAWEANLRRVEEVMDARLKHIEEELGRR